MWTKIAILALLATPAVATAAPADWKALADCAAAYRANAGIKDPSRAPSMREQISDEADSYLKAALSPYRAATKEPEVKARGALKAYVARRTPDFARQKRDAIDHFIDACPQVGG